MNAVATAATEHVTLTVPGPAGCATKIYGTTTASAGIANFSASA